MSAGFDAHAADPLASMELSTRGYGAIARRVCSVADQVCGGRLVAVLEGGYDLGGLAGGVAAMVEAMERAGEPREWPEGEDQAAAIAPNARRAIDQVRRAREAV